MSSRNRYVVLTPFPKAEVVAAILRLRKVAARVVPTGSGACVVWEVAAPTFTDWDISELLGPGAESTEKSAETDTDALRPEEQELSAATPETVAGPLSELSKYGVVLFSAQLGEDVGGEAGVSGMVQAVRFLGGERGEEIPAGIALNAVDPLVESLVIGTGDEVPAGIETAAMDVDAVRRLLGEEK